jgi:hypothetical protein
LVLFSGVIFGFACLGKKGCCVFRVDNGFKRFTREMGDSCGFFEEFGISG